MAQFARCINNLVIARDLRGDLTGAAVGEVKGEVAREIDVIGLTRALEEDAFASKADLSVIDREVGEVATGDGVIAGEFGHAILIRTGEKSSVHCKNDPILPNFFSIKHTLGIFFSLIFMNILNTITKLS